MSVTLNPIVQAYSRLAREYDDESNSVKSCWARASEKAIKSVCLRDTNRVIVDVGCGTGRDISSFASRATLGIRFVGIDPAENMCQIARERASNDPRIEILQGSFEELPLETASVDYLYSVFAFHWVTDLTRAVAEIARVLKPAGEIDLFFAGRHNGREFIQKTSPVFLKYLGPVFFLDSARLRKYLTLDASQEIFASVFDRHRLFVEESYDTYYDTIEGHWAWWVRTEGHFTNIPSDKKADCDRDARIALEGLAGPTGIPYTIHQVHVSVRHA